MGPNKLQAGPQISCETFTQFSHNHHKAITFMVYNINNERGRDPLRSIRRFTMYDYDDFDYVDDCDYEDDFDDSPTCPRTCGGCEGCPYLVGYQCTL